MTCNDWISIIISIVALSFSIFSFWLTYNKSKDDSKESTELFLRKEINDCRSRVVEIAGQISTSKNRANKELLFREYVEQELNAYDFLCEAYLHNRIDKARTKDAYEREIQTLFENSKYIKAFLVDKRGQFLFLRKVYEEWFEGIS